ncbi:MAG TPA: Fe2+-dependent dioxygenase [Paenalcaligenes sp.]|nr:Fe2+-dependent dioxygenase [Paenalcaligenes sp.]
MLIVISGLLTPDEVRQCRLALLEAQWEDGLNTAGYLAAEVKKNQQLPLDNPVGKELGAQIMRRLAAHPQFIAAALPARILPPRFNRYEGGETYGNHIDNAIFNIPGTEQRIRSDVSSTLFLSAPDEYDGGELVIEDTYGSQEIKLAAGDLVVYPGTSLHRVNPVTRGLRLGAFFWTQSMVRSAQHRAMLWELDQSIQRLAQQEVAAPELARLSGVYHNLIREWAEV